MKRSLEKIHKTFHRMVKTCSHQGPKGSGSKLCKDLARPPRTQSHNLCLLQSHLTGGCYKYQYSPACPRVFMMGTAAFKRKARKQSLGTQCVGKYPARQTELRNAANNSIQKPEAWVLAGTWSFHNSNSNSTGSKQRKGSWKINRREIQSFASMKAFPNLYGMTKLPTHTAITDHLSFPLLLEPECLHTITLQVSFSVCCENCYVRLSLLFHPGSALCFGKLPAGVCYPSEPRCQAYDAAFPARKEPLAGIEASEQLSQECFCRIPAQYLKKN